MALTKATLIDLNSNELILDLDADTSITADTDDTIHFKIAGADELVMTGTALTPAVADGSALGSTALEWSDLFLADSATIQFGADQDVTLTHVADSGLALKSTATGDDKPVTLVLQTGETDIAANDVLGVLNFQAPDENTGTDAILVAAGIAAVSEGDFSSSANATKLSFRTAASAAASETMSLTSNGDLFLAGGLIDLKNDGNAVSQIKFYCESSNAHAQTLIGAPHSEGANNVLTLPGTGGDARLVSTTSTATLTNKTLTTPVIAEIDSGADITLDATADIVLDAAGGNIEFKDAGTLQLTIDMDGTAGAQVIKLEVDTDDLIFKQYDGTVVLTLDDDTTVKVATDLTIGDDASLISDAAVLNFGADSEIKLTHVADTGLLLTDSGGTPTLQFHDANESISSDGGHLIFTSNGVSFDFPSADGSNGQALVTNGSGVISFASVAANTPSSADGQALGSASLEWSDLFLADAGTIQFGNDQDIRLIHNADKGLILKHTATADDKPVILTLQTGETDMAANDVIGKIEFQAPDEGTGTDAVLVAAAIQAVSEGDFSASANATRIEFMVGASEAAAKKMQLTSAGKLEIDGGLDVEGGAVFNEDSADVDFRVESNGKTHALFVDGGNDKVGIGIVAGVPDAMLHIQTDGAGQAPNSQADELAIEGSGHVGMSILSGNDSKGNIYFGDNGDDDIGSITYHHDGNTMRFTTNANERVRIFSNGHMALGDTSDNAHFHSKNAESGTAVILANATSNVYTERVLVVQASRSTSNGTYTLMQSRNGGGAVMDMLDSGNIRNTNNSYGSLSDERIKQNITDASSQWDDIKALKIRKYKLKKEVDKQEKIESGKGEINTPFHLGVVAQELESSGMNGLVEETRVDEQDVFIHSDFGSVDSEGKVTIKDGAKIKAIKYSVLYMKAIKALQEAQTRIETLETKVKALEDA